jgi:hypothetical protein
MAATAENSYCLVAAADTFFEGRLHATAWDVMEALDPNKDKALIQATRMLDSYIAWHEPIDRTDVEAVIPQELSDATCELAYTILAGDIQVKDDLDGLDAVGLSGMNLKKKGKKSFIPDHVFLIIAHLGRRKGTGSIEIVRS